MAAIDTDKQVLICGDALTSLRELPSEIAQCCVTSPPYYGLRDYGVDGQIGLEESPDAYVARLVAVFEEVKRLLKPDGVLWLNLGDSYSNVGKWGGRSGGKHAAALHGEPQNSSRAHGGDIEGLKPKDLIGIPWRVAFALQAVGWYLRCDVIWNKPNPMPEPVTDRPTRAHEYVFLFTKAERYYYDHEAIKEPAVQAGRVRADKFGGNKGDKTHHSPGSIFGGKNERSGDVRKAGFNARGPASVEAGEVPPLRNKRSVWTVTPKPFKEAHFAVMPPDLVEPCVLAGSRPGDLVIDPFSGAGTTGLVAVQHGRLFLGTELNPEYVEITRKRWGL